MIKSQFDTLREMYGKDICIIHINTEQDFATVVDETGKVYYNVPPEFVLMAERMYHNVPHEPKGWVVGHLN